MRVTKLKVFNSHNYSSVLYKCLVSLLSISVLHLPSNSGKVHTRNKNKIKSNGSLRDISKLFQSMFGQANSAVCKPCSISLRPVILASTFTQ